MLKEALTSLEKENMVFKTRIDNLQKTTMELEDRVKEYGGWIANWVEFSNFTEAEKDAIRRKLNIRGFTDEEKELMRELIAITNELTDEKGEIDSEGVERRFKAMIKKRQKEKRKNA